MKRRLAVSASPAGYLGIGLVVLTAVFSVIIPDFGSLDSLANIAASSAALGIMAVGATLALGVGAIDFSIAGNAAMAGVIAGLVGSSVSPVAGIAAALVAAIAVGLLNAVLAVRLELNAFVTTLAIAGTLRGVAFVAANSVGVFVDTGPLVAVGQEGLGPIPYSVLLFGLLALAGLLMLRYSTIGRSMLAVGANRSGARTAGIRVVPLLVMGYVASALCAAIAGLVLAGRAGVAIPQAASGTELLVFSAVLLGGTSLGGGRATVLGSVLGILTLNTLYTGLVLLGISPYWQTITQGALLLAAVYLVELRARHIDPIEQLRSFIRRSRSRELVP